MKLQDIYKLAEQWRNNDNKRYATEFYNRVIIDLIDRKQYGCYRYKVRCKYD